MLVPANHMDTNHTTCLVYIAAVQPVTVIDQGRQNAKQPLYNLSESLGDIYIGLPKNFEVNYVLSFSLLQNNIQTWLHIQYFSLGNCFFNLGVKRSNHQVKGFYRDVP